MSRRRKRLDFSGKSSTIKRRAGVFAAPAPFCTARDDERGRTGWCAVGSAPAWEREAGVQGAAPGKSGSPWDTWGGSAFPLAGNWSETALTTVENVISGCSLSVRHLVWELEAWVRGAAFGKSGSLWDTWDDGVFPIADNWPKIGVDHMFDHS